MTEQLGRADAEMGEDLLAAQEQIQELSEQLQAAVREIQDRQAELRRWEAHDVLHTCCKYLLSQHISMLADSVVVLLNQIHVMCG